LYKEINLDANNLEFNFLLNQYKIRPKFIWNWIAEVEFGNFQILANGQDSYCFADSIGDGGLNFEGKINTSCQFNINSRFSIITGIPLQQGIGGNYIIVKNETDTINFKINGGVLGSIFFLLHHENPKRSLTDRPYFEIGYFRETKVIKFEDGNDFKFSVFKRIIFKIGWILHPFSMYLSFGYQFKPSYLNFEKDNLNIKIRQNTFGFGIVWMPLSTYKVRKINKY
jgi:hypothetical protein